MLTVVAVTGGADGGDRAGLSEALGVPHGEVEDSGHGTIGDGLRYYGGRGGGSAC